MFFGKRRSSTGESNSKQHFILYIVFKGRPHTHTLFSYHIHVDAVGVGPGVLEVLLQPLPQRVRDLVETDEFFDPEHLEVIPGRTGVQPLDDGGHVPKDAGVH